MNQGIGIEISEENRNAVARLPAVADRGPREPMFCAGHTTDGRQCAETAMGTVYAANRRHAAAVAARGPADRRRGAVSGIVSIH